ncbi:MAG TPA: ABC transporter ATP-binding protein [Thermoanaerobaculia bacterium]|nr:ABC transporter ATP-binding protein [Thermoanaerobaculia bacterium]
MNAQSTTQFSYTGRPGSYLRAILPWLLMVLLEGGFGLFVILLVVDSPRLRPVLVAAWCAALLYPILGVLTRPFWTQHRLRGSLLELRYGADRLDVPRQFIVAAQPARERLSHQRPRLDYDPRRQRVTACFSEEGQILLELDRPRELAGRMRRAGPVQQILLNVDRPEELLAALDLPVPSSEPAAGGGPAVAAPGAAAAALPDAVVRPWVRPAAAEPPAGSASPAIEARGLTRRYGSVVAVDHLDLRVAHGEIYGFLGPNGAGKTTTIKMMVGLLEPGAGQVLVAGHDVWADPLRAKASFGYVPDRSHLYEQLTGREFLEFVAQLRGLPRAAAAARIEELLALLQLEQAGEVLCGAYSFGMKRKLALAAALLHQPPVLILDEPFNGLDPRSSRRLKDFLLKLAAAGASLLMSTHDLATAEALCTRLGVLHHGLLVAEGKNVQELRDRHAAAGDLEAIFLQLTADDEEADA